jgi:hypothetical protein
MSWFGKRIFIDCRKGLCNRVEIFALAYAIQREFGHEIILGWPKLDVVRIARTRRGYPGLLGRIGALRLRRCSSECFEGLANRRHVILHDFHDPPEKIAAVYAEAASKISLPPAFARQVATVFTQVPGRPVIGIHLRRADFKLAADETYDIHRDPISGVPVWWHEWMLERIVRR